MVVQRYPDQFVHLARRDLSRWWQDLEARGRASHETENERLDTFQQSGLQLGADLFRCHTQRRGKYEQNLSSYYPGSRYSGSVDRGIGSAGQRQIRKRGGIRATGVAGGGMERGAG